MRRYLERLEGSDSLRNGGATILKVWSFHHLVLLQRLAQRRGRGRTGRYLRIAQSTACGSPCASAVELSVQDRRIMLHRHRERR
ncbi:hypothethical protein (plasmid) [Ralstonia solanacearum CMR15]|nr:hypothethical protein [Ralstonia solanacearum CMR15]